MPILYLTDRSVFAIPVKSRPIVYFDATLKGFGIRVDATGRKTWIVMCPATTGPRRWRLLGSATELSAHAARKAARKILHDAQFAERPGNDGQVLPSISQFSNTFLDHVRTTLRPSTVRELGDLFDRVINPLVGSIPINCMTREKVVWLHDVVACTGKDGIRREITAKRVLIALSRMYLFAGRAGSLRNNFDPTRGVRRFAPESRSHGFSSNELARIGAALDEDIIPGVLRDEHAEKSGSRQFPEWRDVYQQTSLDPFAVGMIKLMLIIGARSTEALELIRLDEVDFEYGHVTIPSSGRATKRTIYLCSPAAAILSKLVRENHPSNPNLDLRKAYRKLVRTWRIVVRRAGIPDAQMRTARPTFRLFGADSGVPYDTVCRLLGNQVVESVESRAVGVDHKGLAEAAERIGVRIAVALRGGSPSSP
ncbi:integrase arm-type DNA-binding domain-containing protein [Mesorhizobium sp. A623]